MLSVQLLELKWRLFRNMYSFKIPASRFSDVYFLFSVKSREIGGKQKQTTKNVNEEKKTTSFNFEIQLLYNNPSLPRHLFWLFHLIRLPACLSACRPAVLSDNRLFIQSFIFITMASSQRDMFLSSPESSQREKSPPNIPSSLPSTLTYIYLWVILFDWDENVEFPFDIYQVALFSSRELKKKWISGDLEQDSRQKKLSFSAIKGKTFSLFGKVEKCKLYVFFLIFS